MQRKKAMLIADVGGTKTDIALSALTPYQGSLLSQEFCYQKRFFNEDFSAPEELFTKYLEALPSELKEWEVYGCFAIAGTVMEKEDEISRLTNREWFFSPEFLRKTLGFRELVLINDLTALSYAVPTMTTEEMFCIHQAKIRTSAACGVVAPGTGLGEGVLCRDMLGNAIAWGCEGGHTDFGAVNMVQSKLLDWVQQEMTHVSYEAFLCGSGLSRLYRFVVEQLEVKPRPDVASAMATALVDSHRDGAAIVTAGFADGCAACEKSLALFMEILGSEVGNLALKLLAYGGIYIGGGMLPRFYKEIDFTGFRSAFFSKGKMSSLMKDIPVYLMLAEKSNLRGAAYYASKRFAKKE